MKNLADKLEFKKDVLLSVGVKIEEALERAEQQAHEANGGKMALRSQAKNLITILASTELEVEKSIPDLETLKIVKSWMSKMVIATENAANHLENVELQTRGEIAAHKKTHDALKKMVGDTDDRLGEIRKAIAAGVAVEMEDGSLQVVPGGNGRRPVGMHPGSTIKEQRLAEESAAKEVVPEEKPKKEEAKPAINKAARKKKTSRRKKAVEIR